MPARIFGQAVDRHVRTLCQRLCPERPEEGVVDRDRRLCGFPCEGRVACVTDGFDIDQCIGRVRRTFEVDHCDPALGPGLGDDRVDFLPGRAAREVEPANSKLAEDLGDQGLGRGIKRPRMDDHVAWLDMREEQGGNRRHSAREGQRKLSLFPQGKAIFEDLLVGAVEARVDEAFGSTRTLAGHSFEEALPRCRILEHEGRG